MQTKDLLAKYITVGEHDHYEVEHMGADPWAVDIHYPNDPKGTMFGAVGCGSQAEAIERREQLINVLALVIDDIGLKLPSNSG